MRIAARQATWRWSPARCSSNRFPDAFDLFVNGVNVANGAGAPIITYIDGEVPLPASALLYLGALAIGAGAARRRTV